MDPSPELREARGAIDNIKDKFRTRRARRRVALIARRVELLAPQSIRLVAPAEVAASP